MRDGDSGAVLRLVDSWGLAGTERTGAVYSMRSGCMNVFVHGTETEMRGSTGRDADWGCLRGSGLVDVRAGVGMGALIVEV